MPRDILIMTSDADGIRQLKLEATACELRLPGLPSLRLGRAELEFRASYQPMIAEASEATIVSPSPTPITIGLPRRTKNTVW